MKSRINDVKKVLGGMKVLTCRPMEIYVKNEGVVVSTALYGIET